MSTRSLSRFSNSAAGNLSRAAVTRLGLAPQGGAIVQGTGIAFSALSSAGSPNRVTNGDFPTDTTGWSPVRNATLSVVSGRMRVARNGTNNPAAEQTITGLVAGRSYTLSFDVLEQTAGQGSGYVVDAANPGGAQLGAVGFTADASPSVNFVAPASGSIVVTVQASTAVGTDYADFDNVAVRERVSTITDSGNGLAAVARAGTRITVRGSASNDRLLVVTGGDASRLTVLPDLLTTEAAGRVVTIGVED